MFEGKKPEVGLEKQQRYALIPSWGLFNQHTMHHVYNALRSACWGTPFLLSVLHAFSPLSRIQGEDDEAAEGDANGDEEEYDSDERQEMRERISQKLKKMKEDEKKSTDPSEEDRGKRANRR